MKKLLVTLLSMMIIASLILSPMAMMEEMGEQIISTEDAVSGGGDPDDWREANEDNESNDDITGTGVETSSYNEQDEVDIEIVSEPIDDAVEEQSAVLGDEEEIDLVFEAQSEITADSLAYLFEGEGNIPIDEAHFPDEQFRAYLRKVFDQYDAGGNYVGVSIDGDGLLTPTEIEQGTTILLDESQMNFFDYTGIKSLEGIKYLTNLFWLELHDMQITVLDLSGCTHLDTVILTRNQLESLNVRGCTSLRILRCNDNKLNELDVSGCTNLTLLLCDSNVVITDGKPVAPYDEKQSAPASDPTVVAPAPAPAPATPAEPITISKTPASTKARVCF